MPGVRSGPGGWKCDFVANGTSYCQWLENSINKNIMHLYLKNLQKELLKHGNPENAVPMKKYMRDQFEFFGLKSDDRREVFKMYMNSKPLPEDLELRTIVEEL